MTNIAKKTYLIGVIERAIAYYEVEAEDARTASENWQEGEYHDRDDEALETEGPCNVRVKQPDGTWRKLPRSQWEADSPSGSHSGEKPILSQIARDHLGIPTLETRKSDRLDFHDVAVWQIEAALRAALDAGLHATGQPAVVGLPIRFDAYEIHGVREYDEGNGAFHEQVPDAEAEFWSLYGHVPREGVICIGNFETRQFAEEVYARITGVAYGR